MSGGETCVLHHVNDDHDRYLADHPRGATDPESRIRGEIGQLIKSWRTSPGSVVPITMRNQPLAHNLARTEALC